ncbi:MAG TPA: alpha/beta fold hydrolase [Candidatus Dormibacteraeota bacterium]
MPTVLTNGVKLRYLREGSGQPVLLLHGYLFGADWWRPQIEALKDSYDVVAVDLRGQMGSETTDDQAGYDLWNQAEDVNGLIDALGIAPCHVVGLSMGGMIALRLALTHPGAIRSMVLMDTSAGPENPENAERYEGMRQVVEASGVEPMIPALPPIFLADDFIAAEPAAVEAWLQALREADHLGIIRAGRGIDAREDISDRLGEIGVPTLVIHGSEDVAIPPERAEELAGGIAGGRLEVVSGGHQSNVDRAAETSALIGDFLATVSSTASMPV